MRGMGDIETLAGIVLSQRQVVLTLALVSLVLVPLVTVLATRAGWSWWRVASAGLAGLGAALVVAATLGRYSDGVTLLGWDLHCLTRPGLSLRTPEARLNVVLFGPACFFAVIALRRLVIVCVLAAGLSVCLEVVQGVTGMGTCETSDVVRNVGGAGVAGLLGLVAVLATGRLPQRRRDRRSPVTTCSRTVNQR